MKTSESMEQIALFDWARLHTRKYPALEWLFHIPNGGHRHIKTAQKLKAEGVKAGVPDICLPVARGGFHGLYIELKAGKNKPTALQSEWLAALSDNGYLAVVCNGWQAAVKVIENYLREDFYGE